MKTRKSLWAKYRNEINNNARLQEAVKFSNQKLSLLYKRILEIIPDYDIKYPPPIKDFKINNKEFLSPPEIKVDKLDEINHQIAKIDKFPDNFKLINNIDFSSHELDDIIDKIKLRKLNTKTYIKESKYEDTIMNDVKKVSMTKTNSKQPSIAIDGPSGAGKSTVAKAVAKKYNLNYINTGLVYRAVALACFNNEIDLHNEKLVDEHLTNIVLQLLADEKVLLNNMDVSKEVRSDKVSQGASIVSAYKKVREWAVNLQKSYGTKGGVVMDGRDTTFKIMPNADVKIYLDTSAKVRAKRRVDQNLILGFSTDYQTILKEINERDHRDKDRKIDPLHKTKDAILIDASNLTIEEVIQKISVIIDKVVKSWI